VVTVVISVPPRPFLLLFPPHFLLVLAFLCLDFHGVVGVCLVGFLSQWLQIRVVLCALWHGQAHGCKHSVFLGFLQLALLFLDSLSLGSL
jgi:hypothetical protein